MDNDNFNVNTGMSPVANNGSGKKKIFIILGVVFVLLVITVGVLGFVTTRNKETTASESATQSLPEVSEVHVSLTEDGFSPATVTVKKSTTVVWTNDTSAPRAVGANPYPDASSLPGLKSGAIAPGETYSYTFTRKGSFNYADYTAPTVTGTVEVEE